MDEKYIRDLYDQLGGAKTFGRFDDFKHLMVNDSSYRRDFYDQLGAEKVFGKYDDFDVLVKKKESLGGVGSLVGGEAGISEAPLQGAKGRSGIASQFKGKTAAAEKELPITDIREYNRQFRDITGNQPDFTLGSELPQIKKERERNEYIRNRDITENQLLPLQVAVATGTVTPQQLKNVYQNPYGRQFTKNIIAQNLPDADTRGLDTELLDDMQFERIAAELQQKNRDAGIAAQNQAEYQLDNELANNFANYTLQSKVKTKEGSDVLTSKFGAINTTSVPELYAAFKEAGKKDVLDAEGNAVDKKKFLEKIQNRMFQIKSQEPLAKELEDMSDKIRAAVEKVPVEWKKQFGSNPMLVDKDAEYVKYGLNFLRDTEPGEYKMILGAINSEGEISEQQYNQLVTLGRDMKSFRNFKVGERVEDDNRNFLTPQIITSNLAGWLSEELKRKRKSVNKSYVNHKDIVEAFKDAPEELKNEEALNTILLKEAVGDGIVGAGVFSKIFRDVAEPFENIGNSFGVSISSPYRAYLDSKKLVGDGQILIPQKGGGYGTELKSETILNKAIGGFFQMLTQAAISRGLGFAAKGIANPLMARAYPFSSGISTSKAALNIGTPVSIIAQTYGGEYIDFLEKTGDPNKAALGAFASSLAQGWIEKSVLPDVKLAEDIIGGLRKNFAKEIIRVIENGGGKIGVANVAKDFVSNVTKTLGKEAIIEETSQNAVNYLTEQIISPRTVADRNIVKESVDIVADAAVKMSISSLVGGGAQTKIQRQLSKSQLNYIGVNSKQFLESLSRQFQKGEINQADYDLAKSIVTIHGESVANAPKRDAKGDLVSASRQLEYAYQNTVAEINTELAAKHKDKVLQESYLKKIEEADKIKRQIFYGEESEQLPPKENEPILIDQDRDLMDEEESEFTSRPKEQVIADVPKAAEGITNEGVKEAFLTNPEIGLAEVAQQLHSTTGEAETASKTYGNQIADLALELYPTMEDATKALENERRINAKYDAELAELEKAQAPPQEPAKTTVSDAEALVKGVYHGTNAEFAEFEPNGLGVHFGTESQAKERGGKLIKADIELKNPFRMDDVGSDYDIARLADELVDAGLITKEKKADLQKNGTVEDIKNILKENGYDGIVYKNRNEDKSNPQDSYIVFDKSQIKIKPDAEALPVGEVADAAKPAPAKAKSKLAAFKEKYGEKSETKQEVSKVKSMQLLPLKELEAELAGMKAKREQWLKQGKDKYDPEAFADLEKQISEWEQAVTDYKKGKTTKEVLETEPVQAPQKEGPKRPVKLGDKEYSFIGVNRQGEEIYENDEGVRTKPASGNKAIFVTEPVSINPGRQGVEHSVDRREEYMTKEELGVKEKKEVVTKPAKDAVRQIRDAKLLNEIDNAWDEFFNQGGSPLTSGGINPKKIEAGAKIISLYLKAGIYKFSDIAQDAYAKFGDKLGEIFEELKGLYTYYYMTQATKEESREMDFDVRSINFDDIISKFGNDDRSETSGGQSGISETDVVSSGKAQGALPADETTGKGGIRDSKSREDEKDERGTDENDERGPGTRDSSGRYDVPLNGNEGLNEELGGTSQDQPVGKPEDQTPVVSPLQHNGNFIIPPDFTNDDKSFNVAKKLQDNIDALRVLALIDKENREPTYEEQKVLFKYVGWGGIKEIAFDPNSSSGWVASNQSLRPKIAEAIEAIRELDPANFKKNYDAIRSSTLNAHYTAIPVIRGMWNVLRKGGFKGGNVLEPSAGVGHFIGAMPIDMVEKSRIIGIELDPITAKILKGLYPNHITRNAGYQEVATKNADLVISNIPFGDYSVFDNNFLKSKDPVLKKATRKIHNYFFARAIEDARPGGLIAFVTSTGVLDAKGNSDLREMMAERTEFLGAIRLANNTFQNNANTQVTTDIIFLRKLEDAEKPAQRHRFIESKGVKAKHKDRDDVYTVNYNEYFHDNPEMMLGQVAAGSMYGARDGLTDTMTLLPEPGLNVEQAITDLAGKIFPKDVAVKDPSDKKQKQQQERAKTLIDGKAKIGNIVEISDGVFGVVDNYDPDTGEFSASTIRVEKKYAGAVKNMIALRDAVNNLYYSEIGNLDADLIEDNRAALNEAYQKFRNENGTLLENKRLIERDIDGYNLLTLEKTDGKKVTGLADIFTKRIFKPYVRPEKVESISDAIVINLNETGSIDIDRVAGLLGVTPEEAIQQSKGLLFKNPEGGFEVKDSYLSGNVRKKLDDARIAAKQDPFYEDNVKALEAVQPPNLSAAQIYAPISAAWVKNKYIEEFASEIFKQPVYIKRLSTGKANVEGGHGANVQVGEEYGTSRMNGFELLEEAIQNRIPVVKDTYKDGDKTVTVVNQVETQKAIEKFEKIRQAFDNWVWKDDDRRTDLVNYYNENFNNTVIRKYDGSLLTFEGYAGELTPKQHQLDGAWMIMQQMGGILDHIVGSGKTLLMVLTAQKMKEMGLIKKPIIIGLKANTADLAERYRKSFPLAKILSPTEKDFTPEKRREFFAKIANNDWDAIIMTHDQFGKIPQSKEVQQELMQEEIDALEADVVAAKAGQMSKRDITNLEKRLNNLKTKLLQLQAMDKDSALRDFQEMGIDFMFVDESQQFKNLTYSTLQRGVAGLGDPLGSNKAFNMLTAVRTLQKLYGADKGTVFASGTPISNTMVEMYLLFKYLRPFKMKEMGINTFDQWANTFARVGSEIEFGVTNSLKPKVRMREFMNVPEMAAMYREIADVRNDSNLELDKPVFKKTIRVKTNRNLPVFSTITIGGGKFKVIGRIKGIEKNEFWVSLTSVGKDIKIPESGKITYEGAEIDYSSSEYSDGLLINIPPTQAQRKYAKQIQKFAETKEGRWIGRVLSENEEKAYMLLATNLASKMAIDMRLIDPTFPSSEEGKLAVAADTIVGHYNESEKHKGVQLVFSDLGTPKSSNTAENLFNLIEGRGVVREEMEQIFGAAAYSDKPKYPSVREIRERVQEQLEWSDAEFEEAVIEANEDNFNVYQELKDKMVKRGIPENEIVFIHDFKSDTQRKKLFEEARAGKIRVIIGSTAKLGTGVNVQEKIVALHHIDVPWRPADMEQRNGRGIRQGNAITKEFYNNELPVYMYATEATLDAYKYQLLATKQQFIDQAKTGDTVVREISEGEGDEENGVSFAAMTAMLSGNPVILEKAKIDKKVKELDNSRKAFEQEKYSMRDKISRTKRNIISFSEKVEGLKKDKELFNTNVKRNDKGEIEYEATIDGKLYKEDEKKEKGDKTVRQKVGEKLLELKAEFEKIKGLKDGQQKVVGSINGFDIVLRYFESFRDGRGVEIGIKSPVSDVTYSFTRGVDPVHAAIHIQKEIKDLQSDIDRLSYRVVKEKEELVEQEKYLESLLEEFPRKGEYEKAIKEQQRLGDILSEMTKDSQLPSVEDLESLGQRLFGPSEDYNIEEGGVFAITEDEIVLRVSDNETLKDAQQQNSRFYWYKDELAPEMPDDIDEIDDFQVKEPIAEDVAEMRSIVRDFVEDGQTSLKDIQKAIATELGDNSPEMASLVEEAYFEFTKTSAAVSPKILEDVVDTVRDFVERTVGGKVIVVDNEAQLNEIAAESKEEVAYMQSPDGKILGFVKGDTVFLNGEQINLNTPVHEAGHIWMIWAAQNAPQHLQRGLELVEGSRYLQSVKASPFYQYQAAKLPPNQREAFFRKEALAAAIGDRGAQFVLEAKRSGFMKWLMNLWKLVKEAVGLSSLSDEVMTSLTLDEFAKAVAVDIFKPQPQPAQSKRDVSGIKKALVPIESLMQMNVERMSDNDLMAKGKELIESGKVQPELVIHRIIDSGRGVLTPEEVVGLIYYKRQLDNDLTDAYREWDERTNAGEPVGNAGVAIANLEDKVHNYQLMSVITAQQQSMSFRLRRKLLDSGFNLVKETLRYKRNNSGYIPPEVVEKFKEADRKIKELQRDIDEQRKAFEKAEAERAIKDIQDAIAREEEITRRIEEGIAGATATVYESLTPKRKSYADKALSALAKLKKNIRSRNYDATLGIPAAIIDAGITAIEVAIKTGKTVVEAVEIGINRVKKLLKGKPFNSEDRFRRDMLEGFSSQGVEIDGPDAKFKPRINDDGTITIPGRIIRDLVKSGIDNIEDLTDEVMKLIVPILPDVTHRQVRDFITGYGRKVNMTKDEIAEKIAELKRVGRLLSELEDLEIGKLKETDPQKRARITDRELELKAKVKLLSDRLIRELHIEPTEEDMQRRRDLKEDQLKQQIADLQERIREGDFAKAKKPKVTSEAILDLEAKLQTLKDEVEREQEKARLKNRTWTEKLEDYLLEALTGIPRALVASLDFSATLVQGVMQWFLHPGYSLQALKESFLQFISPKREETYIARLRSQPFYPLLKASGLPIGETNVKLSVKEGVFFLNFVNHLYDFIVTGLTLGYKPATTFAKSLNPFKASQRAYEGYLNHLRMQVFLHDARRQERRGYRFETDPKIFKQLAKNVGTTTGRADLGRKLEGQKLLDILFFSVRKLASEIKLFTPVAFVHYAKMPREVRYRALLDFAQFVTGFVTLNAAIWALRKDWDDDDEEDHFWDITSSDFLSHKVGNTRIGLGSGMKSILVFMGRLWNGVYTDQTGKTSKLGERYGKEINSRWDLIESFFKGKASPGIAIGMRKLEDKKNMEMTDKEVIEGLTMPLWMQDINDMKREHPAEMSALLIGMSILGMAIRTPDQMKHGAKKVVKPQKPNKPKVVKPGLYKND